MRIFPRLSRRSASSLSQRGRSGGRRGFTLIEIALVLVLIGILAAMAITTYRMMINKARMTQAKAMLGHLTKTETIYFSDNGRYTKDVSLLNFGSVGFSYYVISVQVPDNGMTYTGTAEGIGAMKGDWWTITKDGGPVQADNSMFR